MFVNLWEYMIHHGDVVATIIKVGTFVIAVCTLLGALKEIKRLAEFMECQAIPDFYLRNCFLYAP